MAEEKKEETVEIPEEKVEKEKPVIPTEEEMKDGGMTEKEIAMAKKHNLLPDEKKSEEKEKENVGEKKKKETEKPDKEAQEKELIEITDKHKQGKELTPEEETILVPSLDKRGQAFYFQMKNDRRRRQEAENERDLLKVKLKAARKKEEVKSKKKSDGEEDIESDEEIDDLFGEEEEDEKKKGGKSFKDKEKTEPVTKGDLEDIEKEKEEKRKQVEENATKISDNLKDIETQGRANDPDNFDYIMSLAGEMFNDPDFGDSYASKFVEAAGNLDAPEGKTALDVAYAIAKKHPDYKENGGVEWKEQQQNKGEKKKPEEKEEFRRMVKNAGRTSSAALGGGGKKVVALNDLKLEQTSNMTQEQWNKLPHEVRQRLLKE